jgi:hypothetical protein
MERRSNILKHVTALVLLSLFLALHIGKALHHHAPVHPIGKLSAEAQQISSSSDCPICDFHIAKDSIVAIEPLEIPVMHEPMHHQISYVSKKMASIGLCYSDRGPPSIA